MAGKGQAKSGGRQKGTPNKASDSAAEIFRKARFDPLRKMIGLARAHEKNLKLIDEADKKTPGAKLADIESYVASMNALFPIYKELANYAHPKRKAIEIGPAEEPITVVHRWGEEADYPGRPEDADN